MAANQGINPYDMGWVPQTPVNLGQQTLGLTASGTYLGFQFVPTLTKTINTLRFYCQTKNGSPTTSSYTAAIYNDSSGIPGATSYASSVVASVPASGNWANFTGFSLTVSGGTPYWAVLSNTDGTPGTNFPTWAWFEGVATTNVGGTNNTSPMFGWNKVHTLNAGTAWATGIENAVGGWRIGYSDSTYEGFPIQTLTKATSVGSVSGSYGTQEAGWKFSIPSNASFNVNGIWMGVGKVGTPTGTMSYRLYGTSGGNATLSGTTVGVPLGNIPSVAAGDGIYGSFGTSVTISSANNPFRVTVYDNGGGSDSSSNRYSMSQYTFDSDTNSAGLVPFDGTMAFTVTTNDGANPVVFADTAGTIGSLSLNLDTNGEYNSTGSSGMLFIPSGQGD